jgi:2-C-methyl-D-erythritol 4-phosphate cytidylyltransferase
MVVLAAGSSQRMGYDKITADLKGKPVILRTLQAFEDSECVNEIIVVTRNESLAELSDIIAQAGLKKVKKVVEGGKTRAESSNIGIFQCNRNAKLIGIHDGARPLITEDVILRCAKGARSNRACIPGIPPTDTIKQIDVKHEVERTVPREKTRLIQTPQIFVYSIIRNAYDAIMDPESGRAASAFIGKRITDDAMVVESTGREVYMFEGEYRNIKITTPEDLKIAKAFL